MKPSNIRIAITPSQTGLVNNPFCLKEKIVPISKDLIAELEINPEFRRPFVDAVKLWPLYKRVDILVVVDTAISIDPSDDFGVARVIELIRGAKVGCMRFNIDIALRNNDPQSVAAAPAPTAPKYRGFRFDMQNAGTPVIDKYEQIWCFGFKPSNSGNASDAEIDLATSFPASNAELTKLAQWMNERKGGLFGTGDHHFLGASMCRRIPRLGSMRRWTNADGVPPIGTVNRIDTLRPPSPAFEPGAPGGPDDLINDTHQADLTVQPIQWVTWQKSFWPFGFKKRPHPVLCHPTLGPINVMPDHAHEGLCVETADIDEGAMFNFGAGDLDEYPPATSGGAQPLPRIIAYGSTLGDPPYNFFKGPQPARAKFPMISVYDGHLAGVGRVATDSTWHHWMDVNINAIRSANTVDWQKISRYFINLAVWLNPPGISTNCFWLDVVASHFQSPGFQEYYPGATTIELGGALRAHLGRKYGPCWVTDRIWDDLVLERKLWPWEIWKDRRPKFDWLRADGDVFEDIVLGRLVEATMKPALAIKEAADKSTGRVAALPEPEKLFAAPLTAAIGDVTANLRENFALGQKLVEALRR